MRAAAMGMPKPMARPRRMAACESSKGPRASGMAAAMSTAIERPATMPAVTRAGVAMTKYGKAAAPSQLQARRTFSKA